MKKMRSTTTPLRATATHDVPSHDATTTTATRGEHKVRLFQLGQEYVHRDVYRIHSWVFHGKNYATRHS
jgi:hypothetical protein